LEPQAITDLLAKLVYQVIAILGKTKSPALGEIKPEKGAREWKFTVMP